HRGIERVLRRPLEAPAADDGDQRIPSALAPFRLLADTAPEERQVPPRALAPAGRHAVDHESGVDRARARAADRLEEDPLVLKQPVEHAPDERAVCAAALQREADRLAATLSPLEHSRTASQRDANK